MKRAILTILLLSLIIISCDREKVIPGETGVPVYLVPEIEASSDTLGCNFSWSFMQKPMNSNLNVLSFQPSNNAYNIYFIPDVVGKYRVKCEVLTPSQQLKSKTVFLCNVQEGQGQPTRQEISGTVSDQQSEPSESEPIYLEDDESQKTTEQPTPQKSVSKETEKKPAQSEPEKPTPKPKTPQSSGKGLYTIQISSFKSFNNAEKELQALKKMGLDDVYIKKVYIKRLDQVWYRVRTNTFSNQSDARNHLKNIKNKYKRTSAWIDKIK